jgi:acyl dehydratase
MQAMTERREDMKPASTGQTLPEPGFALLARSLTKKAAKGQTGDGEALVIEDAFEAPFPDEAHITRYARAFGFTGTAAPLPYWYLLAQRAQLGLMLKPQFRFGLAGMVHVENAMAYHAEPDPHTPIGLTVTARSEPPTERSAVYVNMSVDFHQGGRRFAECASCYLARRAKRVSQKPARAAEEALAVQSMPEIAQWHIPHDGGRHYAKLSGDWNPIHLWGWSARLFGFKRPIIHGMHSFARAAAEIERAGCESLQAMQARFRSPIVVGSTVRLFYDKTSGDYEIAVNGVPCITGTSRLESAL